MSSKDPFPLLPSLALQKLGKRVAIARRARGLNQRDLAHLAGVGPSSIVALETGHPGVGVDPVRWTVAGLILKPIGVLHQHAVGHARGY